MRVMLINPLRQKVLSWREQEIMYMPLGLGYIAAILQHNGHTVKIVERRFFYNSDYWNDEIMKEVNRSTKKVIEDFSPDLVGITASTPLIMDAMRTAKVAKEVNPNIITVVGGCHPTAYPEVTLKQCPEFDMVCVGEGENTALEIANGLSWDKIDGIAYRKGGRIVSNPKRKFIEDLDILPHPARELFDTKFYFRQTQALMRGVFMKSATIYTGRGCPFSCSFCQSPQLATAGRGKYYRTNSADYIIKEIEDLHNKYGVEGIYILDDMFSITKKRVVEISERLISSGLSKKVKYVAQTRIDAVDDELMQVLRDSNCFHLIFGCESGSDETLARMRKKIKVKQSIAAIKLAHKYKIGCSVGIVLGSPEETEKDFIKTIEFLKKSRPSRIGFAKFFPLPGSIDYTNLTKNKILKGEYENWDELFEKYVLNDFTFANIPKKRFKELVNKFEREIYVYTNYLFELKANIKSDFFRSIKKFIFIFLHIGVLYLPLPFQKRLKNIIARLSYRLRYLFYEKVTRE